MTLTMPAAALETEPRHHTPRSSRPTYGPAICRVQESLGLPPMLWQRRLHDVAGEADSDGSLWYRTVIVRVQRRAGKTAGVGGFGTWRGLTTKAGRLWYTAQNGRYASEWMRDEYQELLRGSGVFGDGEAKASRYVASKRGGAEAVQWRHNRARFQAFPPTRNAMHSKASDWTVIDEAWAFDAVQGAELRQAVRPTLLTRHGSQLWIVSAGGDSASEFLNDYVDMGLASLADPGSRVAFIDYGIPDGADPMDLELIARHHPAYGVTFGMADLEAARSDFGKDSAGFARAYGTVDTKTRDQAIPAGSWDDAGTEGPSWRQPAQMGLGLDATPDGQRWALSAAWTEAGTTQLELIDAGRIGRDTPAQLLQLLLGLGGAFGVDALSAGAVDLADAISREADAIARSVTITRLGQTHMAAAAQLLERLLGRDELRHHHQPELDAAVAAASWKAGPDGSRLLGRKASGGNIAPLVAGVIALREADRLPAPPAAPLIVTRAGQRR